MMTHRSSGLMNTASSITMSVDLTVNKDIRDLRITLRTNTSAISEVIVGPDKAALTRRIIKKAKIKRSNNTDSLRSYKVNAYSKYSLTYALETRDSDTATHFDEKDDPELVESYGTLFFAKPKRYKEVLLAYRDYSYTSNSANEAVAVSLTWSPPGQRETAYGEEEYISDGPNPYISVIDKYKANFDIYQNIINAPQFTSNPIVSTIGSQSFLVYDYLLEESFFQDEKKHYRIRATPKSKNTNALSGEIIIQDEIFAVVQTSLSINPEALLFFDRFTFHLDYNLVDGIYMLSNEEYVYHTKDGKDNFAYGSSTVSYEMLVHMQATTLSLMKEIYLSLL